MPLCPRPVEYRSMEGGVCVLCPSVRLKELIYVCERRNEYKSYIGLLTNKIRIQRRERTVWAEARLCGRTREVASFQLWFYNQTPWAHT